MDEQQRLPDPIWKRWGHYLSERAWGTVREDYGDRYWEITADYAKAAPDDPCVRLRIRNAGPDETAIDVLPTLWFRNTWSWGLDDRKGVRGDAPDHIRPLITAEDGELVAEHHTLGRTVLSGDGDAELPCCENEISKPRLWGVEDSTPYRKDGIADHVLHGTATGNPRGPARRRRCATAWPCPAEGQPRSGCGCPRTGRTRAGPGRTR